MVLTFTIDNISEILGRRALPTSTSYKGFNLLCGLAKRFSVVDAHFSLRFVGISGFWLQRKLRASTSASVFVDCSTRHSGFYAYFWLPRALRRVPSASAGGAFDCIAGERRHWRGRAPFLSRRALAALL